MEEGQQVIEKLKLQLSAAIHEYTEYIHSLMKYLVLHSCMMIRLNFPKKTFLNLMVSCFKWGKMKLGSGR